MKLGAERSKVKIQKLNEMKSWFFKKMKKLIKPLLEKKKFQINEITDENANITIGITQIQRIGLVQQLNCQIGCQKSGVSAVMQWVKLPFCFQFSCMLICLGRLHKAA